MIGALKRKAIRSLALALAPGYVEQAQKTRCGYTFGGST